MVKATTDHFAGVEGGAAPGGGVGRGAVVAAAADGGGRLGGGVGGVDGERLLRGRVDGRLAVGAGDRVRRVLVHVGRGVGRGVVRLVDGVRVAAVRGGREDVGGRDGERVGAGEVRGRLVVRVRLRDLRVGGGRVGGVGVHERRQRRRRGGRDRRAVGRQRRRVGERRDHRRRRRLGAASAVLGVGRPAGGQRGRGRGRASYLW